MKKLLSLFIASMLFLFAARFFSGPVSAHTGSGPPFLLVNGQYAQTNPFYMGVPDFKLLISQDVSPAKYLVNQPIQFSIDGPKLQVPQDVLSHSTFRWSFENGSTDYKFGLTQPYTYSKVGSHLLSVWVKGPQETEYTLIDTVKVDVVPNMHYQLPQTKITVSGNKLQLHQPLSFYNNTTTDKSAKVQSYLWYLDNNSYTTQANPVYTYNQGDFLNYVFLQVTDSNGFLVDAAITVDGTGQDLAFANLDPNDQTAVVVSKDTKAKSAFAFSPIYLEIGAIIIIMAAMTIGLFRKAKSKK